LIGGEVFAYRAHLSQLNSAPTPYLDLIGRGLLGSVARRHSGREPLIYLPLGPVAPLNGPLTKDSEGQLPLAPGTASVDAPALLVSSADGSRYEFITAPNGATAPWLRGLYGSCTPELATPSQPAWTADSGTGLAPLLIGWWPRYASAMPAESAPQWTGLTAVQQSAMLRSRSYSWAGFPLRFYDAMFMPSDDLGSITVLDDAGASFVLTARALSSGFDWNRADTAVAEVALPIGTTSITSAFLTDQFAPVQAATRRRQAMPVDGAELRVLWRYRAYPLVPPKSMPTPTANQLFALINAQANSAPTLGPAVLRCRAPSKVIAVESAR
jgi:hypothetical protein